MKYLGNQKRYLEMFNSVCLLFLRFLESYVSYQIAFWVDFPFNV